MTEEWSLRAILKEIYGIGPEMKELLDSLLERVLQALQNKEGENG